MVTYIKNIMPAMVMITDSIFLKPFLTQYLNNNIQNKGKEKEEEEEEDGGGERSVGWTKKYLKGRYSTIQIILLYQV